MVSGTVAQVSRAFSVELGRYASPTETYRGREGYIHLPNEIADIVEGVVVKTKTPRGFRCKVLSSTATTYARNGQSIRPMRFQAWVPCHG